MQQQMFLQLLAGQLLLPLLLLLPTGEAGTLYFQSNTDLVCPDNIHTCNNETTCCLLPDGQYGCCMYADAVCCSDNIHCCPAGSYCDVNTGSCNKGGTPSIKWSKKIQAALYIPKHKVMNNNNNDDNKESSFGKMSSPLNVRFQQPESIPWAQKLPGLKLNSLNMSSVLSPPSSCSVSQTLCKSQNGLSGCCPFPNAVCCMEGQQCCPSGFTCNLKSSKCEKLTEEPTKGLTSLQATHSLFALRDPVVCPDAVTVCKTGSTCCPLGKDSYACCPYTSATCCSDRQHCCPNGYNCDVSANRCVKKHVDMIMVKMSKWQAGQTCPDLETTCPEGTTCCPLEGGTYGCCPYPNATCCIDQQHCCPQGFVCNTKDNQCDRPSPQPQPQPKSTSPRQNIVCPDQITECASWETCCVLSDGSFGCCPYPKATCCTDHKHCCPHGYNCDLALSKCVQKHFGLTQVSARLLSVHSPVPNQCPDHSYCPLRTTCCQYKQNNSCCLLPQAVCCHDNSHCCPKNYHCDLENKRCVKGRSSLPLLKKFLPTNPLVKLAQVSKVVMCPDQSECPDKNTCCLMDTGAWGCCPYVNAVCCIDRKHCCPKSYFCDMSQSKCALANTSINKVISLFYANTKPLKKLTP